MGKLNMEALMKAKQEMDNQNKSYNNEFDKLVVGKNVRRVLFPKGDNDLFYETGYLHFGLGPEGKTTVTCPKTWGRHEHCPVCEYVEKLRNSSDPDDKKLASDIRAVKRTYINVLNRDSEDPDKPMVLAVGATILKGIIEVLCDPDYLDITDPETGRDITINRKGQGLNTEYSIIPKPTASKVSKTKTEEELDEEMADLKAMFIKKSYDEIKAILDGEEYKRDDDEEEEEDDDEEYDDEEETAVEDTEEAEEEDYDDLSLGEIKDLCESRGINVPKGATRMELIKALKGGTKNTGGSVMDAIADALDTTKRKNK